MTGDNRFPKEDTRGNVVSDPRFGHFVKERPVLPPEPGNNKHTSTVSTRSLLLKVQTFRQAEKIIRGEYLRNGKQVESPKHGGGRQLTNGEDSFLARLKRTFKLDNINEDVPLVELGIDSLMAVDIRNWFTKELSVHVPIIRILSNSTINDLVRLATEKQKIVDVKKDELSKGYSHLGNAKIGVHSDSAAMVSSGVPMPSLASVAGVSSPAGLDTQKSVTAGHRVTTSTLQTLSDYSRVFPF